ncbi:hypothetical protein KKC88_00255 [Patescibacteria group bacterium]|nr:hypothetical protein [Patescibacteria group bacterium]MBU1673432.1 hypothetical protein [Patescibacteria group bacterium]MBU1963367.1 hypothetical protein [Patescibacteria group bacterium]
MNIANFLPLLSAFFVLGLGIFVFIRNWRSKQNQIFFSFCIALLFWLFGTYMLFTSSTDDQAIFWDRFVYIGVAFVPTLMLHFSFVFTKEKKQKWLLYFAYALSIFFIIISRTDYFVADVFRYDWGLHTKAKFFHHLFLVFFTVFIVLTYIKIYKYYKSARSALIKQQAKYIFIAFLLLVVIGSVAYLPAYGIGIYPFAYIAGVIFSTILAYAIIRYRFMNIRVVLSRSILYFLLVVLISGGFVLAAFLIGQVFADSGINQLYVGIIVSLVVVLGYEPLKNFFARITDRIFYKEKIDYQLVLREVSTVLSEEIELNSLVESFGETLADGIKIKYARLYLSVDELCFIPVEDVKKKRKNIKSEYPSCHSPLVRELDKSKEIIIFDEYERKAADEQDEKKEKKMQKIIRDMEALNALALVPVFRENKMTALLVLGPKISGDPFSNEDIRLLQVISPQVASALEKAKLYQEAQMFNVKLQKEVDKATASLKKANAEMKETNIEIEIKNKNLNTLQRFSSEILKNVEFKKISHEIINSIPKEIKDCENVLLSIVGPKKRFLVAHSIPENTAFAKGIFALIGDDISKYKVPLTSKTNIMVQAIKDKRPKMTTDLKELVSPPLPIQVADKIAKMPPIAKSFIIIPIVVGDEAWGTMAFSLTREPADVAAADMEMMSAVTRELGIALERSRFYEKLQSINEKLTEANEHLKDLDRAKSEFMSIASHQLRTPLSGVMGYLSMILEGDYGKLKKEQKEIIEDVFEASQRLIRLVNVFLNVTRIEAGRFILNFAKIDMVQTIEDEVHELMPTADKKGITLIFNQPRTKIPEVIVDPDKIKDVVLNLVDNAIKYTKEGEVIVGIKKEGKDMIHVTVKDSGVGIDPEEAKHLFDKFVRGSGIARVQPDGSGLGLFIARRITEAHGGEIWVDSKGIGKGSTFHFTLSTKDRPLEPEKVTLKKVKA